MIQKLPSIYYLFSFGLPAILQAQTFSSSPALPLYPLRTVHSTIEVSGLPEQTGPEFGLESICLNLTHREVRQLIITVYSPDGTLIKLTHLNGREDDFQFTCFRDDARPIQWARPPFYGAYKSVTPLGVCNNGQNPNGIWRIVLEQLGGDDDDTGILERWSLSFGDHPVPYQSADHSTLPLLFINTGGQYIPGEPKIPAQMGVVDHRDGRLNGFHDPFDGFEGNIGIEWRGSSSKTFWQPSFTLETRGPDGADLDVPLLGLPAESDWVLHGPFTDKSLLRNALSFDLAARASTAYVPRTRFCELVLDHTYLGVYLLTEKIKRGSRRLNIAKLKSGDTSGDALTGGYILQVDRNNGEGWYSPFRSQLSPGGKKVFFNYVYPKAEDLNTAQANYIQSYVDSFELALYQNDLYQQETGWRHFADETSFADFFLMNELCKNVDAYRLSSYFYKPRDSEGGKLHAGPLWDFNLAWRNADYNDNASPAGWTYDGFEAGVPFWWRRLAEQDTLFTRTLRCRWQDLRGTVFSQRRIFQVIDSLAALVAEARDRHFELYPILGRGVWPNPKPLAKTHAEELYNMKTWISQRLAWIDAYLPGSCPGSAWPEPVSWMVYPNPAQQQVHIYLESQPEPGSTLEICDMTGRPVLRQDVSFFDTDLSVAHLGAGFYILVYKNGKQRVIQNRKLIIAR